jgi:hypothetical protein
VEEGSFLDCGGVLARGRFRRLTHRSAAGFSRREKRHQLQTENAPLILIVIPAFIIQTAG